MTADRRGHLASALFGVRHPRETAFTLPLPLISDVADALLPTIDRMIRQAQAEALEAAANELFTTYVIGPIGQDALRDRAAALRSGRVTTDGPDVAHDAP